MKILLSAFACAPGQGSEPGLGWGVVSSIASEHDVWVLTHPFHQPQIAPVLRAGTLGNVRFMFPRSRIGESPRWDLEAGGSTGGRGLLFYPHYVGWQVAAFQLARQLHQSIGFDLVHHVTYANSWLPSCMGWLAAPFIWSAGAREHTPRVFLSEMSRHARRAEVTRNLAMTVLGEATHYITAKRADLILTASDPRCWAPGLPVRRFQVGGVLPGELDRFAAIAERHERPFRVASIGRLLGWKGFGMGLRAFAQLRRTVPDSEYWVVGNGPERGALEALAHRLGCAESVRFKGWLPREEVLEVLANTDVLLHPSLHEQFGFVLLEAMAAGRPVICLAAGGPTELVGTQGGIVVDVHSPRQVVADLAHALEELALDPAKRLELGRSSRQWVLSNWTWDRTAARLQACYDVVTRRP